MTAWISRRVQQFALGLFAIVVSLPAFCEPRPLTRAESEAVRVVAAHLADGPSAFWNAAGESSRFRALGESEGVKEIELRVGPRDGAEWELVTVSRTLGESMAAFRVTFPSGIDDTIIVSMIEEKGGWRVGDIRSMSDPVRAAASPATAAPPASDVAPATKVPFDLAGIGALALLLGSATVLFRRRFSRALSLVMGTASVVALLAGGVLFYLRHAGAASGPAAPVAASMVRGSEEESRQMMVDLRRRVAAGGEIADEDFKRAAIHPEWRDRALLWSAQLQLQRNDLKGALATLGSLRQPAETPLAQVIEGRAAFLQNREVDAVMAYERAMELGPERDDLRYETASVLLTLGFDERAEGHYRKLDELGSREADAYYALAALDAMDGSVESAEKHLQRALALRPELRSSLVRMGVFHEILRRPAVQGQLAMHRSAEPLFRAPRFAEQPLTIPPGASARCLGDFLEIDFAGGTLRLPGGAFMAPPGAAVFAADAWDREETSRALNEVAVLARMASQPSAYAQPALSRRIEETANALLTHNRWADLATLTHEVSPESDLVPVDLLLMKALSKKRTGKPEEARSFLESLVARPTVLKRLNARQLLQAGELLASVDSYQLAIRLMDRAAGLRELPHLDDRVRQLNLNQRIATFSSHQTPHFVIRYSEEMSEASARTIGEIAEAELVRLKKWIPLQNFRPVTISVISWETFRGTYTGSDHILGFYDGKITIPFAGVGMYPPEIVAILSHELAHAMIAQRTNEQAPRWFQEGLAQRVESVEYKRNPFNMYEPEQMLSLAILDDAIGASPDPDVVGQGYITAQALIRYIESRWGTAGIIRFLDRFASGGTTVEAIEAAGGGSMASFDDAFRAWGLSRKDVFENSELVSYEQDHDAVRIRRKR